MIQINYSYETINLNTYNTNKHVLILDLNPAALKRRQKAQRSTLPASFVENDAIRTLCFLIVFNSIVNARFICLLQTY